ncbi:MAG: SBBP repeat-containing protein [Bacteroidota bacterium]
MGAVFGQNPGKTFGGTQNEEGYSLALLTDGNYGIVGRTRSQGAGADDAWILKVAPTGRLLWARTLGSSNLEHAHWVEPTADGGMVVLGFSNGLPGRGGRHDFLLIKLDALGNIEWQQLYGAVNREIGFCVKPTRTGGYVLLGYSRSVGTWGDIYLVGTDSAGTELWAGDYGTPFVDYGHEVEVLPDGGFLILGSESGFYYPTELDQWRSHADMVLIRTDSVGNEVWYKTYGGAKHELGRSMCPAADGGWYLFGSTQSAGAGSFDQWLLRLDANGDSLWSRTYGGPEWDYGNSIARDSEGNLYLLGTTNSEGPTGSPDIWLQKADAEGNVLWGLTIGGARSDYGYQVRALPEGGCLLVGATRSFGQGEQDLYLVRVTAEGQIDLFLEELPVEGAPIYPVPVTGISTVDPSGVIGDAGFEWRVYDVAGRRVQRESVVGGNRTAVSAAELPSGVYVYEIWVGEERRLTGRFLVE